MASERPPVNDVGGPAPPGAVRNLASVPAARCTRSAVAAGRPMADRYIYQVAVEAFFLRAMQGKLDAVAKARLRDAGMAVDEPLLSVYPADVFHRCVAIAAEAAYPAASPEDALYRVGKDHIDAFIQSYPGKMMVALARLIEPQMIPDYTATLICVKNDITG